MLLFLLGTEVIGMFGGWRTPRTADSRATKMQPSLIDFFGAGAGGEWRRRHPPAPVGFLGTQVIASYCGTYTTCLLLMRCRL